jgi:formylglycine-generating enzyme required for sulfatase activity
MRWVPAGTFLMGSDAHYPEEAPAHKVAVDGFWIDSRPVTNEAFAQFVAETRHTTVAEIPPDPAEYPGALPELLHPGSLVFQKPGKPVDTRDMRNWWAFTLGADWRHPGGRDTDLTGMERHPVVHVAFGDAEAYAKWAGKSLPTEAEWERAARGGLEGAAYAWGNELMPHGRPMANFWQGRFPHENTLEDGWESTSPVGMFPPNGYGLFDMIGNVWEWTDDWYAPRHQQPAKNSCCVPRNPRGGSRDESIDLRQPEIRIPRKVLKGGSHLCSPDYCQRYRPAARYPEPVDTSTSHVGFRCIIRPS